MARRKKARKKKPAARKPPWLASRHPARELRRLAGSWSLQVLFPGVDTPMRGTATFKWLEKNALMVMRSSVRGSNRGKAGPPTSVSVLGADDVKDTYTMLYSDERGVTREYTMKLTRATWTLERKAPRFSQRFTGRFAGNGRVIRGFWEKSTDGRRWHHDFLMVYKKK
jgi:hypothetical protein